MADVFVRGDEIKKLRERASPTLSQQDLGIRIGLTRNTIGKIEKGGPCKRDYITRIAAVFKVEAANLIDQRQTQDGSINVPQQDGAAAVHHPAWVSFWRQIFLDEIVKQLKSIPKPESSRAVALAIERASRKKSFQKRTTAGSLLARQSTDNTSPSYQVGIGGPRIYNVLSQCPQIKVAVPADFLGAIVLFRYLIDRRLCNIDLDFEHILGAEIINDVLAGLGDRPSACVVADPQVVRYFAEADGDSLRLSQIPMPRVEVRFVSGKGPHATPFNEGLFCINTRDLTTQIWEFENRFSSGSKPALEHLEVFESLDALLDDRDTRTVLWAPRWNILEKLGLAVPDVADVAESGFMELFMLNESFDPVTRKAFHGAIIDAWLTLRDDRSELVWAIEQMIDDSRYMQVLERSLGISGLIVRVADHNGDEERTD